MAAFVRHAEQLLKEVLVATEHDQDEHARSLLGSLFYDIDRYLLPEPWQEQDAVR